jgi:hypothetical protein
MTSENGDVAHPNSIHTQDHKVYPRLSGIDVSSHVSPNPMERSSVPQAYG